MNPFRKVLLVFFVAFVSWHTAVDATDYVIPEACRTGQEFSLVGDKMNGPTFIYGNPRKITVKFYVILFKIINPNATWAMVLKDIVITGL
ncbi:unnamed protein product [Calicophoron daubneyi]|uniref:Uncharacterized protein n=1 Tax=Calicophoron daubneyi TaxID=300641 RepID=A0AAV2TT10_CALDB